MLTVSLVILAVIAAVLIWLSMLDGSYSVTQSRRINTDINTAFDKLRDFKSWSDWSPWLLHEPGTLLNYSDNCDEEGGHYSWDGNYLGAGRISHVRLERPHRIQQRIEFMRPFRLAGDVVFAIEAQDGQTRISWSISGKMPFFLRFMTRRVIAMISKDYAFGLARLGGVIDPTAEHPQITFGGETRLAAQRCLCQEFVGSMTEIWYLPCGRASLN